jgi:hypothetical protein
VSPLEIARVILPAIIVIGFVAVLGVYSFSRPPGGRALPAPSGDLVPGMIGVFGTGFMAVVYYWFPKVSQ